MSIPSDPNTITAMIVEVNTELNAAKVEQQRKVTTLQNLQAAIREDSNALNALEDRRADLFAALEQYRGPVA